MAAESDVVLKVLLQLLIPPGKIQKKLPLRRGGDGRVGAVKQLEAQLFFQLAQLLGEGRLGDEQVLCRQRDVFAFVYFQHISENVGVHNKAAMSSRFCWLNSGTTAQSLSSWRSQSARREHRALPVAVLLAASWVA